MAYGRSAFGRVSFGDPTPPAAAAATFPFKNHPQQNAEAAYRLAWSMPAIAAFSFALFYPPDSPPLAFSVQQSVQQSAQASYRASYSPASYAPAFPFASLEVDNPPLQTFAQQSAQIAYRPAYSPAGFATPFPFGAIAVDAPPLQIFSQQAAQAAYRSLYSPGSSAIPFPFASLEQDAPPLRIDVQQFSQEAYRPTALPVQQQTTVGALFNALGDPLPLFSVAQSLAAAAYRSAWTQPYRFPMGEAILEVIAIESPPLTLPIQQISSVAFRPPAAALPSPNFPVALFSADAPPLALYAQQAAQIAYRSYTITPAPLVPPAILTIQEIDDPPLQSFAQRLASIAFRPLWKVGQWISPQSILVYISNPVSIEEIVFNSRVQKEIVFDSKTALREITFDSRVQKEIVFNSRGPG